MSRPSVIIIGAGLSGLATGIFAQQNGYQCTIYEHGRPMGGARRWRSGDPDVRQACGHADVPPGRQTIHHIVHVNLF